MPLISSDNQKKIYVRVGMNQELLDKVSQYCSWAGIKKRDHFFNEAIRYILDHDPLWLEHQKKLSIEVSQIISKD